MANAKGKGGGMGAGRVSGHQHVGTTDPDVPDEHDLANQRHGSNRLQAEDQSRERNQRLTAPGSLEKRSASEGGDTEREEQ